MDTKQFNKLAMFRAVQAVLAAPPAPLASIPAFAAKKAALATHVAAIDTLNKTQSQPTRGAVGERDQQLEELTHATLVIAGKVLSYAAERNLLDLVTKVKLKPTDFASVRKQKQVQLAQQVHDAAHGVVAQLADYEVTPASMTALQTQIDAATAALSRPRNKQAVKKAATGQLPTHFRNAVALLENEIDPLVFPLSKTHPEFYAEYQAARIIIDRRGGGGGSTADSEPPFPPAAPNGTPPPPTGA